MLSAQLRSPVLSWWGDSPAEGGEGDGRIEKLRREGGSGELPIGMQGAGGEINPLCHKLHLPTAAVYAVAVSDKKH